MKLSLKQIIGDFFPWRFTQRKNIHYIGLINQFEKNSPVTRNQCSVWETA